MTLSILLNLYLKQFSRSTVTRYLDILDGHDSRKIREKT